MELWLLGRPHDPWSLVGADSGPDPSHRYIRSERSVILINFCLSIISSNALILIGQTQTRNKVGSLLSCPAQPSTFWCVENGPSNTGSHPGQP